MREGGDEDRERGTTTRKKLERNGMKRGMEKGKIKKRREGRKVGRYEMEGKEREKEERI